MRHVDAKIKILLVLFYYYNFTFVSIMNCDRQKFSIVTLHESKVHYAHRITLQIKSRCPKPTNKIALKDRQTDGKILII